MVQDERAAYVALLHLGSPEWSQVNQEQVECQVNMAPLVGSCADKIGSCADQMGTNGSPEK